MRVHHYLKNLLVFAALACGGEFFAWDKLSAAFIGFVNYPLKLPENLSSLPKNLVQLMHVLFKQRHDNMSKILRKNIDHYAVKMYCERIIKTC